MNKKLFYNKIILITGGTGSFGFNFLKYIIKNNIKFKEIRIFSRDEKKQDDVRKFFNNSKIKFIIGDVRDLTSIENAIKDVDYVFHASALKQVPSCEFYPLEAYKTNVLGTDNLINSAISNNVKKVICLSTDKAVYPINAMGLSKAMMEKVAISKSLHKLKNTKICVTRYGNVLGTRGSILPLVLSKVSSGNFIPITNFKMTRFLMTMDKAIELVLHALENGENGDLFIQKTPSSTIHNLIKALLNILNKKNYPTKIIGSRHGEKLHETLMSQEEAIKAINYKNYYLIKSDIRSLNYDSYFTKGMVKKNKIEAYSSNNTSLLDVTSIEKILKKLDLVYKFKFKK